MSTKTIKLNKKGFDLSGITGKAPDAIDDTDFDVADKKKGKKKDTKKDEEAKVDDEFDELFKDIEKTGDKEIVKYDPIATLSKEELAERRSLIIKINRYQKAFPNELKEWKDKDFTKSTIPELENQLEDIKMTVSTSNTTDMGHVVYSGILNTIENVGGMLNLKLKGLSDIANHNMAIKNCVKECTIEYTSTKYVKPHMRLGLLTLGLCYQMDSLNRQKDVINDFLQGEIKEEKLEEYSDL
jgi:hypothetical protein